ncbi:hypothetical protein EXD82_00915 [Peptacetobacter hominis]|uniref:Membrane-spanning protein n=1 Tax=Peptacetobacter hominis TaxID=2743610 RepID=A0A544QYH8_9FIRM|nr:DUF2238 domain-containing protein [Peptacetobacter hominis]TQQ85807.1 hypothetical protein EXD82_00915 [Peptacetobacter hominis]
MIGNLKKKSIAILLIFYICSFVYFVVKMNTMGISVTIFGILSMPVLIKINQINRKLLSDNFFVAIVWYICIASILGSGYGFYDINHYDDFLHILSGILSATAAYDIILYFENDTTIDKRLAVIMIFMFSMGVASLWEIMEFSMDTVIHTNTQVGGLSDTVIDMIDAMIGSIFTISLVLYKKIKNHK